MDSPVLNFLTGERRIRVHTMCLPVVTALSDVYLGADVQAITGLLANMGKHDKSLFGCMWMTSLKLPAVILWAMVVKGVILSVFNAWPR